MSYVAVRQKMTYLGRANCYIFNVLLFNPLHLEIILTPKLVKHPEIASPAFSEMMIVADNQHRWLNVFHKIILDNLARPDAKGSTTFAMNTVANRDNDI